ncbi:MAG TPA: hypothetical protein VJR25_16275 [Microbacterium sp.]|uniref:hypothetical protein n=1 Tax=Microbacterium sp. TaxID=51671 RepID=UPI002B496F27|nr:hypothetical protein [Microbacterium sp.]HKT58319.1 hypothetical protein [Microbacterium sp.]
MNVDEASAIIRTRPQLVAQGMTQASIGAAVRSGGLHKVGRGCFVEGDAWDAANHEARHLMTVVATDLRAHGVVFSHVSACILHGLPLVRHLPGRVHTSGRALNGQVRRSEPEVARHQVAVLEPDITDVDGIRCTTLARSVADTIRCVPEETALTIADAAMRRIAWDETTRTYDVAAGDRFRSEVRAQLPVGGRGVKQARMILDLADGRADGPGESISRLYLVQLGYPVPTLQARVRGQKGAYLFLDMLLEDLGVIAEFDGMVKYSDPEMLGGRSTAEAVLDEKAREDWIRGVTGMRVVRWGWEDIASVDTLRRRLRAFGLYPPGRPRPASDHL